MEITQHTWTSQVRSPVVGESVHSPRGFALSGSIFSCGAWAHSLMNLKHKSSNLKHRKKKKQVAQMGSYLHQPRSLKQRKLVQEGTWLLIFFVAGAVSALEVDAISCQSLRQVLGLPKKRKPNPWALYYPYLQ